MLKIISSLSLVILIVGHSVCLAQSSSLTPQARYTLDNAANLLIESQNKLSSYYQKNQSQIDSKLDYLSSYEADLKQDNNSKEQVLNEVETKLEQKLLDLYSVKAQLDIYPNIVEFSNQLVSMSDYYRQQAGIEFSEETLSSGNYGQHFQNRRKALSLMIAQLNQEIINLKDLVTQNKVKIQKHSKDLKVAITNPSSTLTVLGFDHFLNLKIALLSNQEEILHDVSRLDSGADLDNTKGNLSNLCESGTPYFSNLKEQNDILVEYTKNWVTTLLTKPDYNVSKWSSTRTGQQPNLKSSPKDIDDLFGGFRDEDGISWPGLLSSWKSCRGTKYNIYADLQNKIDLEIKRGRYNVAIEYGLLANDLETEINQLDGQLKRLEQIRKIYQSISTIAAANAFFLDKPNNQYTSPAWKLAVFSQSKNFKRLEAVKKSILLANRKLVITALNEILALASLDSTSADFNVSVETVSKRLEALIKSGFEVLEAELISASDSLKVMSLNIASAEGETGNGGLGEAISTYELIIELRNDQIIDDAQYFLPESLSTIQLEVNELENNKSKLLTGINTNNTKLAEVTNLEVQLEEILVSFNRLFSLRSPHPLYAEIANDFVGKIKLSKKLQTAVNKELLYYVKSLQTVRAASSTTPVSPFCTNQYKSACKSAGRTKPGKKIKKLYVATQKALSNSIEQKSVNIMLDHSLSTLESELNALGILVDNI